MAKRLGPRVPKKIDYEIIEDVIYIYWMNRKGEKFTILMDKEDIYVFEIGRIYVAIHENGPRVRVAPRTGGNGKPKNQYLSRIVMNAPIDMEVDHIFHNTLDNRKSQLRFVTHSQNGQNKVKPQKNNKSGVRGVYFNKYGKWQAQAKINGVVTYAGSYNTIEEAEKAVKQLRLNHQSFSPERHPQRKRTTPIPKQ